MANHNTQLAQIFNRIADILTILDESAFKINANARVARTLESMTQDVSTIGPNATELAKIQGIGKASAEKIAEFLETGKIDQLHQLTNAIPKGLLDLLPISGLGPKTISLFWKQANVTDLTSLKAKIQTGELEKLPRIGKKKLENISKSIQFIQASSGRIKIAQGHTLATHIIQTLSKCPQVIQATYAGSLRRGKETLGDLDILVSAQPADAQTITHLFLNQPFVHQVLVTGKTKTSIRTQPQHAPAIQIDLRIVSPTHFAPALLYFTGSKEHNVQLRQRAIKQNKRLNEYGITDHQNKNLPAQTETQIYQALGLPFIPPTLRQGKQEINLAEQNKLPHLIQIADIKADLHTHTTASDGRWSIRENALDAAQRGQHTIAITDHSKSQFQANGLDEKRMLKHIKDIHAVRDELKDIIQVLAGSEVDILADGTLDYPDEILSQLDIVVASPHAALSQDDNKATHRLLKAIQHPHVNIIGHPTGRLVGKRKGLQPDIQQLIQAAKTHQVALEINANAWRLDLRDFHAHAAIIHGTKLAINTDAHAKQDKDQLIYGILTAQRAYVTTNDVINCMPPKELLTWLKKS